METKDQVVEEVKTDQSSTEQSEKTEEGPTLEKTIELVKGLQKGFTQTRQEMSEMRDNLQVIADASNKQTGATAGEDEYLTVGKLKEILNQQSQEQEMKKSQADQYIERGLGELKASGIVSSHMEERVNPETGKKELFNPEEEELINLALKLKEPNLMKASVIWQEIKFAKDEARKETAKTKVKQEEGSKVGTSSKTSEGESRGIDYNKVVRGQWW